MKNFKRQNFLTTIESILSLQGRVDESFIL
jgi:hypothetical protein